mmetsp:Transcript_48650/g.109559  ORF Transcript_48650/g.109559 Transcript_48650/m.109559 type:complete len:238 (-) Transcript_48650:386-1099(-)
MNCTPACLADGTWAALALQALVCLGRLALIRSVKVQDGIVVVHKVRAASATPAVALPKPREACGAGTHGAQSLHDARLVIECLFPLAVVELLQLLPPLLLVGDRCLYRGQSGPRHPLQRRVHGLPSHPRRTDHTRPDVLWEGRVAVHGCSQHGSQLAASRVVPVVTEVNDRVLERLSEGHVAAVVVVVVVVVVVHLQLILHDRLLQVKRGGRQERISGHERWWLHRDRRHACCRGGR